jgi:hypothetical protein
MSAELVEHEVSRAKLERDVKRWSDTTVHRERGWILLKYEPEHLLVELAILAKVTIDAGPTPLPVLACAVRLTYENYDLWAPSLTFVDVFTRKATRPHLRAFQETAAGPRNVLIDKHPATEQPFLCVPGIREYHTHPQHSGDSWLLYRDRGEGSISIICDRLWQYMARTVVGLRVELQALPVVPLKARVSIQLAQGPVDAMLAGLQGEKTQQPAAASDPAAQDVAAD